MHYPFLGSPLKEADYKILTLREKDIYSIMRWRNEQMDVLRQNRVLTPSDQQRYFEEVVKPTFHMKHPPQALVSFIHGTRCIGYGGITNIDWVSKRGEVSFLLDTERINNEISYEREFTIFLSLLKKLAFENMHLNRLFTETFDFRKHHISILEKNGFQLEGRMRGHVFIQNQYHDSLLHGCLAPTLSQK